jgi:hypothetical protein
VLATVSELGVGGHTAATFEQVVLEFTHENVTCGKDQSAHTVLDT